MKVDQFRKTWIRNFPESELSKYQHAIDMQGDPLLVIKDEAYDMGDRLVDGWYSVHYSGKGYLDIFWNTLLDLKPIKKKDETKKKRVAKKKVVRKKKVRVKKETNKKLLEF